MVGLKELKMNIEELTKIIAQHKLEDPRNTPRVKTYKPRIFHNIRTIEEMNEAYYQRYNSKTPIIDDMDDENE